MKWLVQGHTADKWQGWDSNPGLAAEETKILTILLTEYVFAGTSNIT